MTLFRDLSRAVDRHRRVLAALAAAVAVMAALTATSSSTTPTTAVVVAAREIPAGTTLSQQDVTVRRVRTGDLPDRALTSPTAVVGKVTGAALPRNGVLTELALVPGRAASAEGRVVIAVKVADAELAKRVAPGMRVALLVSGGSGGLITDDALVVATPQSAPGGPLGGAEPRVLLVDVTAPTAERLVRVTAAGGVTVALH